jgi:hypothetical protein
LAGRPPRRRPASWRRLVPTLAATSSHPIGHKFGTSRPARACSQGGARRALSAARDWLEGGAIPKDDELASDLTGVEYSFNINDQIQLERKESMKARGLASPDSADALALTFAVPTALADFGDSSTRWDRSAKGRTPRDYDPHEEFERELGVRQ